MVVACGSLAAAAPSSATPGALQVLVTGNCFSDAVTPLAAQIQLQPDVASVTTFDTSTGTPTAATLASEDLVVSLGDDCTSYADQTLWGNELADYVDAGGVVLQAAYDNWNAADAHPTGRFASGGYPPLDLGPNDNQMTTLGEIEQPNSPIVQGLGTFTTLDNTTTPLATGATLLAKWADGRNAIAIKGRVVATSASADDSSDLADIARLARNTGDYLGRHLVTVTDSGSGTGTVASTPAGISCGASCSTRVAFGDSITLTATPAAGSTFAGWEGACSGTGTCTVTNAGSDAAVTAVFIGPNTLTVGKAGKGSGSVTSSPAGIDCGATCSNAFTTGTTVTLSAAAGTGSTFVGWSGSCSGKGMCTVVMSADRSVTATFAVAPPNTKISKASISSKKRKAAFKFKAIGAATRFQCALRPSHSHKTTFKSCRSPKTYKHLKPGKYTFEVRAVGVGGTDPTPAKKSFNIKS
jgi:hypothetical protein